ncbi:MAG: hypothetical protein ABW168_29460 [Sedimenticola sp.]
MESGGQRSVVLDTRLRGYNRKRGADPEHQLNSYQLTMTKQSRPISR